MWIFRATRQIKNNLYVVLMMKACKQKLWVKLKLKAKQTMLQVLMLAKQEEASMIQIRRAWQTDAKMMRTGTCRYCGSSHPPRRCPAYGVMCGECSRVNHFTTVCRALRWRMSRWEEQSNGQTNQVKSNHFSHNYKSIKTCIETEISTTSFYNSIDIRFELDTGRSKNYIPFHVYKKLFPKVHNMYIR